jgi:endonuclease/exonuclease/phosphatase family metal-dependent hydrolase
LFVCLLLLLTSQADAQSLSDPSSRLKCLSFNLLHGGVSSGLWGNGQDLEQRLEIVTDELRQIDADIIGLQEASEGRGRQNIAERLADELGYEYVFAPASSRLFTSPWANTLVATFMNFAEGPAILSRYPILNWDVYDLPRCGTWTDPRVLLCAELQTPWGPLQACSTHISRNACQAKGVADIVQRRPRSSPLVLMGDFNTTEQSEGFVQLTKETGLIDTFRLANPTAKGLTVWQWVYADRPMAFWRVDYLFLRPGSNALYQVRSSRVVLHTPKQLADAHPLWPSDHYGVLTEFDLSPAPK